MKPVPALRFPPGSSSGRRRVAALLSGVVLCGFAILAPAQPVVTGADPAKAASVVEMARYLPLRPGNQWSFIGDYGTVQTLTAGNRVSLSGVSVVPLATAIGAVETGTLYLTNDSNGLRRYREYVNAVDIPGYGSVSASATFSPPILHAPAFATVGSTYPSSGAVTFVYTGLATVNLSQESSTQLAGFETVTDYSGTQAWEALKMIGTVRIYGSIYGEYVSITSTSTYWLAEGVGIVQSQTSDESGAVATWKLTSANVALATAPGAPVGVGATAGDAQATVRFTAPADDGGAPVTRYTATSSPGGGTGDCSAPCSAITVAGLANGVAYTFTVTATNAMGTGPASAPSGAVTPGAAGYLLTVARGGNGTVTGAGIACGSDCSESFPVGASVTLTATPAPGSTFAGWTGDCVGNGGACTLTMSANRSVHATFASLPGQPVGELALPATGDCATDFYIAEATLANGANPGYWGMEVALSNEPRELRGGFNLGGGFDGGGLNPGFGAFSLSFAQRVTFTVNAQPLAGPIELAVDLLEDNLQRIAGVQGTPSAAAPLVFAADLAPGFYVVRINSTPTSDRGTFQLQLYTPGSFAGGVVVGGYLDRNTVGSSLTGFGAFCVPQSQPVRVALFGPSLYGANAAGDLVLTLRNYQRQVLGVFY